MTKQLKSTEARLEECLPPATELPTVLHRAMRYAVLGGGKRVRPLLAFAAAEIAHADIERATWVGIAVELIHAYSLVHDDLPCMDDDVLRRGMPTCHVKYGEAMALLVGDALQSLAFGVLSERCVAEDTATQLEMVSLLAQASGSYGMAGGQAIDLSAVGLRLNAVDLEQMHSRKTGAMIRCAVALGARCSQQLSLTELTLLDDYARIIGLAFQVIDDVLDEEAPTSILGKTAGKDAKQGKPTYVSALGLSGARTLAENLLDQGLAILEYFDESANNLRRLATYVVKRTY